MLVYLDTNIVVYLVEEPDAFGARAMAFVRELLETGHGLAASHLVRMECRIAPLATGSNRLLAAYDVFFSSPRLQMLDLPAEVFDTAARYRAAHRLSSLDALHLATAVAGGCEAFLTNDTRLAAFPGINVMLLP